MDAAVLQGAAGSADAVIRAAGTNGREFPELDRAAVAALLAGLEGSAKAFIYTSGIWVHGPTGDGVADEETPLHPPALVAWRPAVETLVLLAARQGLRAMVIRPGMVYGRSGGMVAELQRAAQEDMVVRVVGDGENRWPMVHADDLARLYTLMLEKGTPGAVYLGTEGPSIRYRMVAEAACRAAGARGHVAVWPLEQARKALGPLADAVVLDQQFSSAKAKRELGWAPARPSVLEDLGAL